MQDQDFNLRHVRALCAAVELESVSKAAEHVHLTQPAVTHAIAKLEDQIGHKLFDRVPGGVRPTQAALRICPRFQRALQHVGLAAITMVHVKALLAVAQHGSYAAARRVTGVSEPSLHRALRELSEVIGQALVVRRGRGIALTENAEDYRRRFQLAMRELSAVLEELDNLLRRDEGRIAIGAMPLCRARILPEALVAFHAQHPGVELKIVEGSYDALLPEIRNGSLDLMIGAQRDETMHKDVQQRPLFRDQPAIFARAGHPLVQLENEPDFAALSAYPWVVPGNTTPLRRQWEAMFKSAEVNAPSVPIECGSVMTIQQILMRSDFLTLLSPDQLALAVRSNVLVKLKDAPIDISRNIGLTTRADWAPTPLQTRFIDTLFQTV